MNASASSPPGFFHSTRFAWVAIVVASIWSAALTPVLAQEAYYWNYAQHPALSYFDHPPMVAWGIAAGESLLGSSPLGIRLLTLLSAWGTTLFGQRLLREFGASTRTQAAWILASLAVPHLAIGHFLANPDAPLCFFWTATLYALVRASAAGRAWWILAGFAAGGALLSKYTSAFIALGGVLALVWDPGMRRRLATPGPWLALAIAAACFGPVVFWNAQNDWASFRFQTTRRYAATELDLAALGRTVVEQILLFSPFFVAALPPALLWLWRESRAGQHRLKLLLTFGLPLPVYMFANAASMTVKPNWLAPAAIPLVLGALLWVERTQVAQRSPRATKIAGWGLKITAAGTLLLPALAFVPFGMGTSASGWSTVCEHVLTRVAAIGHETANAKPAFVFAPDYRDASQLAYHLARSPQSAASRLAILAQNTYGEAALQFDWWTRPREFIGRDAIFVAIRPHQRQRDIARAASRFRRFEKVDQVLAKRLGIVILRADIFVGTGYLGPD